MKPDPVRSRARRRLGGLVDFVRARALLFAYGLFTFLVFVLALVWSLPHDLIAAQALDIATARAPVRISFRAVTLAFPNGYRFTDLRVTPTGSKDPAVVLSEVTLRLPFTGLLTGSFRQALFTGRAYGGDFAGYVRLTGARVAGELEAKAVRLEPALAPFLAPPGRVEGEATVSLRLAGDGRTTQSSEGDVSVSVQNLKLDHVSVRGFRLPDLAFPTVDASAQVFGARLQVKEARAAGDDLNFAATGDVLLREPVQQSVLNLRMTIEVPPNAQPALRIATGLLPKRAPGEAPAYALKGTIAAPVLR
jgi:type II secretion system protein N